MMASTSSAYSPRSTSSSERHYSSRGNKQTFHTTPGTSFCEEQRPNSRRESLDTPTFDLGLEDASGDSVDSQVYLSVVWSGGKLGAAYYDTETTEIYMLPDTLETESFHLLKTIIHQMQPQCVAASTKQDERLLKAVQDTTPHHLSGELDGYLVLLPSIEFSADISKRRVLYQDLPSIPKHFNNTERLLYMSSLVDFEKMNMVRAMGGLLKLIEKKRVGIELEDAGTRVPVLALKTFCLHNVMQIDENTYTALQIFHTESHPSVYKSGAGREGTSLFRLLNRCRSVAGVKLLRLWFLRPLTDLQELHERQESVAYFQNPRNLEITACLQKCLKQMRNISRILLHMTQAQATPADWKCLHQTIFSAVNIKVVCQAKSSDCPIFTKISQLFSTELDYVSQMLTHMVDLEQTAIQNRFVVKYGWDEELDRLKRSSNCLSDLLSGVEKDVGKTLPDDVECNIIHLPHKGFFIVISYPKDQEVARRDLPGLNYIFKSSDQAFYRNEATATLDERYGENQTIVHDAERARERDIMHQLQNKITERSQVLLDIIQCAAELDCLISLGICAKEQSYCRPTLSNDDIMRVQGGKHPLQELCCSPYVPNDTLSGGEHSRMKLLTGPNASGKSVYLKQVALIVFMAQIGSFVPVESAEIGLVDGIFSRICTMESVSVGLSAFMIDLNQMSNALRSATGKSLVVIDEFGKGTLTEDGVSLLCSSLSYWLNKGDSCPHVFVSSHFHSVIQQHLLPKTSLLQYQTMDVMHHGTDMVFLYKLVEGSIDQSFAGYIAEKVGLPEYMIARGAEVTNLIRQSKPVSLANDESLERHHNNYITITSRFLDLDLDEDDINEFLQKYVKPCSDGKLTL